MLLNKAGGIVMPERINAVKTTFFGKGAVQLLGPELQKTGVRRVLIVTDRFLYQSGACERVGRVLSETGIEYAVYYNVMPNPTVDVVNACIEAARGLQVEMLIALGGGSAIDTAKAASIVLKNGGRVEDYEGVGRSKVPGLPIAAINTTAGTGSECTTFYIVTDPVRHSKMAMVDTNCMVSIAINDVDFMSSMPPKLTAATGMDALTHGIEAVLSVQATPFTDKDALWAIRAITENLKTAVADGSNQHAREMMAYAENAAGMAFSNAGLGMVHAMAHALGGRYNLPHGVCNAVLLPYVLRFTAEKKAGTEGFSKIAEAMGLEGRSPEHVIRAVAELGSAVGIPDRLSAFEQVDPADFHSLAQLALKDSCMATNPVSPSEQEVADAYQLAFKGV